MSVNSNQTSASDQKHLLPGRPALSESTKAPARRMPAGGWLREIAMSENWRTTTIVQRHRDRAASPSSP